MPFTLTTSFTGATVTRDCFWGIITALTLVGLIGAATSARGQAVDIREWLVPWEDSEPAEPMVGPRGRVWFVSTEEDFVTNFSPASGNFNRYDLRSGTEPSGLLVDDERNLWFVSGRRPAVGKLIPGTGRVVEYEIPERRARDPRMMIFDRSGNIWFTISRDNYIGRLEIAGGEILTMPVPTRDAAPYGMAIDSQNQVWIAASATNLLLRIDGSMQSIAEFSMPSEEARPRRVVVSSDDKVWYTDFRRGRLGRFDPVTGNFTEWLMPGGDDSRPFGMAIDRSDRIWIVETGGTPNRLVGFDTGIGSFLTETSIPSGAGSVSQLNYHEPSGEVWFGTQTNYIGRAKVH